MNDIQAILARLDAIQADRDYMLDNYSGCDWCCGGGDQWWEDCDREQELLESRLAELTIGCAI